MKILLEAEVTTGIKDELSQLADLPTSAEEANAYFTKLLDMLEEFAVTYGGRLLIALLLLFIGFRLVNVCTKKIIRAKALNRVEVSTRRFVGNISGVVFKILIGITALAILGVPMSSIVAVVGSCGLAIGLALQGSLANIAGGFILMLLKPFVVGDYIALNASGSNVQGHVDEVGIFYTTIITLDNKRVVIPNSTISSQTLTNYSAEKLRRVDIVFTASYGDDIDKVENVLLGVCEAHEKILDDPKPFARLTAHSDSALEYTVKAWCKTEDYWTVYYDLFEDVKKAFDKNGISIPFPQVEVTSKNG